MFNSWNAYLPVGLFTITINPVTIITVLGLVAKAYVDFKNHDQNAFFTDLGAIATALGLTGLITIPGPKPEPVPPPMSNR